MSSASFRAHPATSVVDELAGTLPEDDTWRFGGIPYGLEPLFLPPQWVFPDDPADTLPPDPACLRLGADPDAETLVALAPRDDMTVDRLFWFRWVTGHQATFLLWQLLAATMSEMPNLPDGDDALRRARLYVRGYSQLLLYTSSCPREIYDRVIRSVLSRQHPNFSGSWAPDYAPVRELLRGKVRPPGAEGIALTEECLLNDHIHNGIAAKLVPSGVSLLQHAKTRSNGWGARRGLLRTLYDGTFLTTRAPVSHATLVIQLVRRLQAINLDIAANGLHLESASSAAEEPPELRTAATMRCKADIVGTLTDIGVATWTAGTAGTAGVTV